jgi:small-conductance mechanosensitive channel
MVKRISLRSVVAVAAVLGILVPIALLVRTLLLGRLFGSTLELLLYPGSIFLFDSSRHSSLSGLNTFVLSLMVTVTLYVFAAMILFGIFRGIVGAWRFVRRR